MEQSELVLRELKVRFTDQNCEQVPKGVSECDGTFGNISATLMSMHESKNTLPATMQPDGNGYVALYCAAQWIATKGGTVDFDPADVNIWQPAFADLLAAAASGDVHITGVGIEGLRVPIAGYFFAGLQVDYPFSEPTIELFMGEEYYLRSYPYDDEEDWHGDFSDAITNRHGDRWNRLMVAKPDIANRWSFEPVRRRTGAPGRPALSAHLIRDELERRGNGEALEPTVGAQAAKLVEWLKSEHPMNARPTIKTVSNQIRARYRALRGPK